LCGEAGYYELCPLEDFPSFSSFRTSAKTRNIAKLVQLGVATHEFYDIIDVSFWVLRFEFVENILCLVLRCDIGVRWECDVLNKCLFADVVNISIAYLNLEGNLELKVHCVVLRSQGSTSVFFEQDLSIWCKYKKITPENGVMLD